MSLKNEILNNKESVVNKYIRISGKPAIILGAGPKTVKLGFPIPKGFSHKKEVISGFVNYENFTPELTKQIRDLLPESSDLEEEKEDFFEELFKE